MALLFGLLHGLGFAGALREIGLPEDAVLPALLFFNLGVELGQLLFVALVLGLGWGLRRLVAASRRLAPAALLLPRCTCRGLLRHRRHGGLLAGRACPGVLVLNAGDVTRRTRIVWAILRSAPSDSAKAKGDEPGAAPTRWRRRCRRSEGSLSLGSPRSGKMRLRTLFALMVGLCVGVGGARAQTSSSPPGWEFSVTPYTWLPGLSGTVRTPLPRVGDQSFDFSSGTVVGDLSSVPVMVAGEARYGRFSLLGDFFYAALEQDLDTRDVLWRGGHARVTSAVGTLLGTFRVLDLPRQSLDVGAGTRIWDMSTKVSLNPGLLPG